MQFIELVIVSECEQIIDDVEVLDYGRFHVNH